MGDYRSEWSQGKVITHAKENSLINELSSTIVVKSLAMCCTCCSKSCVACSRFSFATYKVPSAKVFYDDL
jgi:hypothetical protein